jgi:hypothetical protein
MPDENNPNMPQYPDNTTMLQDLARVFAAAIQQAQQTQPPPTNHIHNTHNIKLPAPDTYNGVRDPTIIDNWIYSIENHQQVYGMDDIKTYWYAKALLKDSAQSWIRYLEDPATNNIAPTTWTELKKIIIHKFRPTNDEDLARDVLVNIIQRKTIREYVDEFMNAIMAVKTITDAESTDRFMRGLKDAALIAKIRAIPKADRTLEKVFEVALAHEFAHNPSASRGIYASSRGSVTSGYRDDPMELDAIQGGRTSSFGKGNNKPFNASKSGNSSRGVRKGDLVCNFCNKKGHSSSRCFLRAEEIIAAAEGLQRKGKPRGRGSVNYVDDDNKDDNLSSYSSSRDVTSTKAIVDDHFVMDNGNSTTNVDDDNNVVVMNGNDDDTADDESPVHDATVDSTPNDVVVIVDPDVAISDDVHNSAVAVKDDIRAHPAIEAIPVVLDLNRVDNDDDPTSSKWVDSIYLTTLLNATVTSALPLYDSVVFTQHSSAIGIHCLIDNGASENYISSHVADLIQGTRTKVYDREVETAGGAITAINEKMVFELDLQGHRSSVAAYIFDTKFDVILGRAFLKKHNPKPDWFDDTWKLSCCSNRTIIIKPSSTRATAITKPQLNYLVSHLQAEDMLKEDGVESCFLYLMDEKKKDGIASIGKESIIWTKKLMKDFPTVFKDKLTGLPPIRDDFAHVINVPDDAKPINRPPFRMSPAELDELQRQLNELSSLGSSCFVCKKEGWYNENVH